MNLKATIILLTPSLFFTCAAVANIYWSTQHFDSHEKEKTENAIHNLVKEAQTKDLSERSDWLLGMVKDIWRMEDAEKEYRLEQIDDGLRGMGYCLLIGAIMQIYVILRVRSHQNRESMILSAITTPPKSSSAPPKNHSIR